MNTETMPGAPLAPDAASQRSRSRRHARLESLSVSLGALVVVGAGILGLWATSTHSIRENYRHYLIGLAEAAATLVDPALHDTIRRPEQRNDPDYKRALEPLRRMRKARHREHQQRSTTS